MKDQVFMSPNNGEIVVGIPLFKGPEQVELETTSSIPYRVYLTTTNIKPLAYILDAGDFNQVLAAAWVEEKLICLGDL